MRNRLFRRSGDRTGHKRFRVERVGLVEPVASFDSLEEAVAFVGTLAPGPTSFVRDIRTVVWPPPIPQAPTGAPAILNAMPPLRAGTEHAAGDIARPLSEPEK